MCGYLELDAVPVERPRDPMRAEPREVALFPATRPSCPGCGHDAWADPRLESTALVLRGTRSREQAVAVQHPSIAVAGAQVFFALGMLAWLLWAATHPMRGSQVGFAAFAALLGTVVASKSVYEAIAALRPRPPEPLPPERWHLALPVATRMRGDAHGPARALGDLIGAPLTGRTCIAYELGVLTNVDVANREATWLLREQRSTAFAVGSTTFPENAVRLRIPAQSLDRASLDHDRLARVLNERAFSLSDTDIVLVESIIAPGDLVTVANAPAAFGRECHDMPTAVVHA